MAEMLKYGDPEIVGKCYSCDHERLEGDRQPCDACVSLDQTGSQWRQAAEPTDDKTCDNCANNLIPRQVATCETCGTAHWNWEPEERGAEHG